MKIRYEFIKFGMITIFLVSLMVIPAASNTDAPTTEVMTLGGIIEVNGNPAPDGTLITAKSGDEFLGDVEITNPGTYGQKAWNLLIINEPSIQGNPVILFVKLPGETSAITVSDNIKWLVGEFDLNFAISSDIDDTYKGSVSGGRSSTSSGIIIQETTAEAGGSGDNTLEAQSSDVVSPEESENIPISTGGEKSNSTIIIVIGLILILAIGAYAVIRK